jgi:hypothetical protein
VVFLSMPDSSFAQEGPRRAATQKGSEQIVKMPCGRVLIGSKMEPDGKPLKAVEPGFGNLAAQFVTPTDLCLQWQQNSPKPKFPG